MAKRRLVEGWTTRSEKMFSAPRRSSLVTVTSVIKLTRWAPWAPWGVLLGLTKWDVACHERVKGIDWGGGMDWVVD